jgi:hypothetical protein
MASHGPDGADWPAEAPTLAVAMPNEGSASTSSGHADKQKTIRVTAVFTEFDPNIDVGAPGFSLGDEVVFPGDLLQDGRQVGRVGVVCTFVSTANADRVEAQCPRPQSSPVDRSPSKA